MYLIITSKPGQFRAEAAGGLRPVESHAYLFYGQTKAHFVIAELQGPLAQARVRVTEEGAGAPVNLVPAKFLERFETIEQARAELAHLTHFGTMDTALVPA